MNKWLDDPRAKDAELATFEAERAERRGDVDRACALYRQAALGWAAAAVGVPADHPNTRTVLEAAASAASAEAARLEASRASREINPTDIAPMDAAPAPPPPRGKDADYLTRDIETELENAVRALVDQEMADKNIHRRQAAVNVKQRLGALLRK